MAVTKVGVAVGMDGDRVRAEDDWIIDAEEETREVGYEVVGTVVGTEAVDVEDEVGVVDDTAAEVEDEVLDVEDKGKEDEDMGGEDAAVTAEAVFGDSATFVKLLGLNYWNISRYLGTVSSRVHEYLWIEPS